MTDVGIRLYKRSRALSCEGSDSDSHDDQVHSLTHLWNELIWLRIVNMHQPHIKITGQIELRLTFQDDDESRVISL